MSVLHKDSVKIIAESLSISNLSDDVAQLIATDVEYRLREIVQESLKFMNHSRRTKLSTEDINSALRLRRFQAVFGYSHLSSQPIHFRRTSGMPDLYYVEDEEISLEDIINSPIPKCPRDITFTAHWLAIEGKQPLTRWNPAPVPSGTGVAAKVEETEDGKIQVVKQIVKHTLSRELQLYYTKITQSLLSGEKSLEEAACNSLKNDPGINQLLPYLVQWTCDQITHNLKNLSRLFIMLDVMISICDSVHLHIEPYLHQMMPAIITLVATAQMGKSFTDDHWTLRRRSAILCASLCDRFGAIYQHLQPRVTKAFINSLLDPTKALTSHFGSIVGISAFGRNMIGLLLIPNIEIYFKLLEPELSSVDPARRLESQKVYEALLDATGKYVQMMMEGPKETAERVKQMLTSETTDDNITRVILDLLFPEGHILYQTLSRIFGDKLLPYIRVHPSDDVSTIPDPQSAFL